MNSGATNRRKGVEWEQRVARVMRILYPNARRNYQPGENDTEPDVSAGDWAIECKCGGNPPIISALKQARDRAKGRDPLALIHVNGTNRWVPRQLIAVLELEAFLEILLGFQAMRAQFTGSELLELKSEVDTRLEQVGRVLSGEAEPEV